LNHYKNFIASSDVILKRNESHEKLGGVSGREFTNGVGGGATLQTEGVGEAIEDDEDPHIFNLILKSKQL
jgi:hypothetical protein